MTPHSLTFTRTCKPNARQVPREERLEDHDLIAGVAKRLDRCEDCFRPRRGYNHVFVRVKRTAVPQSRGERIGERGTDERSR